MHARRGEGGQSFVEFAVALPVLLMLLIGSVEAAAAFNTYITVTSATRDAARAGSSLTNAQVCSLVTAETERLPGTKTLAITRTIDDTGTNQSTDTMNNSCTCADGIVAGTTSGHMTASVAADRYMEVTLNYTHSSVLGISAPYFPLAIIPMSSNSRFPVARFVTTFNKTAAC